MTGGVRYPGNDRGNERDGVTPVDLAFDTYGHGPPVVVLHGLFGAARNWRSISGVLARQHRILALDLRNHGRSPWSADMGYPAMAADVAAYLETHELARASLIGHSLGGKAAMWLALTQPQRVAALIVVDIAPVAYRESLLDHVEAVLDVQLAGATRRAEIDEDLTGLIPDPGTRGFILQNLVRGDDGFRWQVNLEALRRSANALSDYRPEGRFDGPTLFIAGEHSSYITPSHRAAIETHFPKAEIITIAGAGHRVHADRPAEFAAAVDRFLAAVPPW